MLQTPCSACETAFLFFQELFQPADSAHHAHVPAGRRHGRGMWAARVRLRSFLLRLATAWALLQGEPADPYWKHVRYLFLQMWGLKDAVPEAAVVALLW